MGMPGWPLLAVPVDPCAIGFVQSQCAFVHHFEANVFENPHGAIVNEFKIVSTQYFYRRIRVEELFGFWMNKLFDRSTTTPATFSSIHEGLPFKDWW